MTVHRTAFATEPPAEYVRVHEPVLSAQRAALQAMKAGQITGAQADAEVLLWGRGWQWPR